MIKLCDCGLKETIQPYGDARQLKGVCTKCRKEALTKHFAAIINRTKTVKVVSRAAAKTFLSQIKFR